MIQHLLQKKDKMLGSSAFKGNVIIVCLWFMAMGYLCPSVTFVTDATSLMFEGNLMNLCPYQCIFFAKERGRGKLSDTY